MSEMTFAEGCRFCALPDARRVLWRDSELALMFSVGPLVVGHMMLLTRAHYSCIAEPQGALGKRIERQIQALTSEMQRNLGAVTLFEHGRAGACVPPGHGEDHCYHAHLHLLPLELDLVSLVERDYPVTMFESWAEFRDEYAKRPVPYLAMSGQGGSLVGVVFDPENLPRHYLRSRIAEALGEALYGDWVAFQRPDLVDEAINSPEFAFLRQVSR